MRPGRRTLRQLAVIYLVNAALGATVAMRRDLRGAPAGIRTGLDVRKDLVFGLGTALSPPLALWAYHAALIVLSGKPGRAGDRAAAALTANGVVFLIGMLAEPIVCDVVRRPGRQPVETSIVAGNIVVPLLTIAAGLRSLQR